MDSGKVKVKWASSLGKNWRWIGKTSNHSTNKVDYYEFSLIRRKNTLRQNKSYTVDRKQAKSVMKEPVKTQNSSMLKRSQTPSYSVKYMGVTNGDIGVLSKRMPLPKMSIYDQCRNSPMLLPEYNRQFTYEPKYISGQQHVYLPDNFPTEEPKMQSIVDSPKGSENSKSDEEFAVSAESYVVTNYARPRGLSSIRDDQLDLKQSVVNPRLMSEHNKEWKKRYSKQKEKTIETPLQRRGVSGWKLWKQRSMPAKPRSQIIQGGSRRRIGPLSETPDISGHKDAQEPYLKYLDVKYNTSRTQSQELLHRKPKRPRFPSTDEDELTESMLKEIKDKF